MLPQNANQKCGLGLDITLYVVRELHGELPL
jgi:hypothetical protein